MINIYFKTNYPIYGLIIYTCFNKLVIVRNENPFKVAFLKKDLMIFTHYL